MKKHLYGICLILLMLAGCVFLEGVDQPTSAKAGEEMTITMHNRMTWQTAGAATCG